MAKVTLQQYDFNTPEKSQISNVSSNIISACEYQGGPYAPVFAALKIKQEQTIHRSDSVQKQNPVYVLFASTLEIKQGPLKVANFSTTNIVPFAPRGTDYDSAREDILYFTGTYDEQKVTSKDLVMLMAYQTRVPAKYHNLLVQTNKEYWIYCLVLQGVSLTLYKCKKEEIGKLVTSNGTTLSNRTLTKYPNGLTSKEGFYLNAGWIEKTSSFKAPFTNPGKYIGYDSKKIEHSNITDTLSRIGNYPQKYELVKNGDIYYKQVEYSDDSTDSGGTIDIGGTTINSIGDMVNSSSTPKPLDLSIGSGAISVSTDYIDNFSGWNINFIPNHRPKTDDDPQTDQPTVAATEYYPITVKNILTIKDKNKGVANMEYYANEQPSKLCLIRKIEDQQEQLWRHIDLLMKSVDEYDGLKDERLLPKYYLQLTKKKDKEMTLPETITILNYFSANIDSGIRGSYLFDYYSVEYINGTAIKTKIDCNFPLFLEKISITLRSNFQVGYDTTLGMQQEYGVLNLYSLKLFEAFTRGHDFIQENFTTVRPEERDPSDMKENSKLMNYMDNYFTYKYSGRNIDIFQGNKNKTILQNGSGDTKPPVYIAAAHSCDILQETDVTLGETYGEQEYFAEAIRVRNRLRNKENNGYVYPPEYADDYLYKDSFKVKDYLDVNNGGFDSTVYIDDNIDVITGKIDLLRCDKYAPLDGTYENNWCDCRYSLNEAGLANQECIYQKEGYCPYRFQTEKHPRRIRTLEQAKSNRFNLIQELSKTFKYYPYFYIEHDKNGRVKTDENGRMKKHIFFMTEKGNTNQLGFRYERNLSGITRTTDSNAITTKLYVTPNDSKYSASGQCSIDTASDNISKTNYIVDFSYYIQNQQLDADTVKRDLYGEDEGDFSFLTRMGYYNQKYDDYSNLIITLTGETLTQLQAQIEVSTTGIATALEERKKIAQRMYQFKKSQEKLSQTGIEQSYVTSDSYKNYVEKYREQAAILWGLVNQLFFSGSYFSVPIKDGYDEAGNQIYKWIELDADNLGDTEIEQAYRQLLNEGKYCKEEIFWYLLLEENKDGIEWKPLFNKWTDFKEKIIETKLYPINGLLGQYKSLYNEVFYWKTERAKILNKINDLYSTFSKKYEPYIKEGVFSNSNYLTDNEYYWAADSVLKDSGKPKVTYSINVINIEPVGEYFSDYNFELADTTYVEDIDFFGINKHTGLPNKQKVILTELTDYPDQSNKNSIAVKNYTSAFDDLFSAISASVQSLTFNENIYKRASNFTAKQYIETESLQDTLDLGDLTLLDTKKDNIVLDDSGAEGNDINNTASQYKLTGEGLFFSTDGGETWDLGVGPKGLNLDYAKFGSLDTSKIQIVDGQYIYFLWDKDGINAYRNPATSTDGLVDFARFNKYGLSLIENENIRLRAGYEYLSSRNGNISGNYKDELELTDQNVGFYLYNDKGQPIFKTETRSAYSEDDDANYTTRLSLTGEIFATNKVLSSGKNTISGQQTTTVDNYATQYIFKDTLVSKPKMPETQNIHYTYIQALLNSGGSTEESYVLDAINADYGTKSDGSTEMLQTKIRLTKTENIDYEESGQYRYLYTISPFNFYTRSAYTSSINQNVSSDLMLISYIFGGLSIQVNDEIDIAEGVLTSDITTQLVNAIVSDGLSFEEVKQIFDLDNAITEDNVEIGETDSSIEGSNNYIITTAYGGDKLGYWWGEVTEKELLSIDNNAKLTVNQNVKVMKQSIAFKNLNGENQVETLYIILDDYGNNTYWKEIINSKTITDSNQSMSGEVGIYINNKKGLQLQEPNNINDDTTDFRQWVIDKNTSPEDFSDAVSTLYSGAERVFSIAAGRENGTSMEIDNVLSVLKNGVLYMGGTITDKYGKRLDVSGLSYLPDEIKIYNPSIVMSNSGQIWCDWDQFFYAKRDPQTGIVSPTNVSLLQVFEEIQNWSGSGVSGGDSSSGTTISGYFIDEADVDANV